MRFPIRAVFGELKNLMPRMNKTATPMKMRAMVEFMLPCRKDAPGGGGDASSPKIQARFCWK
jgi:hypothetical protein